MIFLQIVWYFYYLHALTLVDNKSLDQEEDLRSGTVKPSQLVLVNGKLISQSR